MTKIKAYIRLRRDRADRRRRESLLRQAERDVQLREFDGGLYLCLGGVPLVWQESTCNAIAALKRARESYVKYVRKNTGSLRT